MEKNNSKGLTNILLLIIIILIVVGGYYLVKTNKATAPEENSNKETVTKTEETPTNNNLPKETNNQVTTPDSETIPDSVQDSSPYPTTVSTDVPPPLGNETIQLMCGQACNTSGVNSWRSDFYAIVNENKVRVVIDAETRLRYVTGKGEEIRTWAQFYPQLSPRIEDVPFGATVHGEWIDEITFKANWIKWSVGS